jgi:hypothetical protein
LADDGAAIDEVRQRVYSRFEKAIAAVDTGEGWPERCDRTNEMAALAVLLKTTHELVSRIRDLEKTVGLIRSHQEGEAPVKDWYTVAELAGILGKAEFTVREWCRQGRVYASKRACGRGNSQEWIVSREEIDRIRNEGLLPG